jgi:hypothetical protein
MDPVIERVRNAVIALCEGQALDAEKELCAIDFPRLIQNRALAYSRVWEPGGVRAGFKWLGPGTKRKTPRLADIRAIFTRDHYTCRYSHCQRQTICVEVLRLLSSAFPEIMPYHRNWSPLARHILYWTYSTSLEHLIPFAAGDISVTETHNLLTACYECNDVKNYLPAECLGWQVSEPADTNWKGLSEYVPLLRSVTAKLPSG